MSAPPERTTAPKVALAFLHFVNECGDLVTNLKLQKLLYFAQGWSLGLYDRPLFDEPFEAWIHGPVCRSVYDTYKEFKYKPILVEVKAEDFPADLTDHVRDIWETYGSYSTYDLERMSHNEPAWKAARTGVTPDTPSFALLSLDVMKAYFRSEADRDGQGFQGTPPAPATLEGVPATALR